MNQQTASPDLEELSAELVQCLGRLTRTITRESVGLSTSVAAASLRLLSQIDELEPISIGALAVADHCSQPTMSAGISGLVESGWATKRPNPADARSHLVTLTGDGRRVLRQARRERATVIATRLRADTRHDERDLATTVSVLRGLLEQHQTTDVEGSR